jgi:hypothetical protein
MNHKNPVHSSAPKFPYNHFNIIPHLILGVPSGLFLADFQAKIMHAFLISPMRATCPGHFNLLDVIAPIIFAEENKQQSSLLCNFLYIPVTSS